MRTTSLVHCFAQPPLTMITMVLLVLGNPESLVPFVYSSHKKCTSESFHAQKNPICGIKLMFQALLDFLAVRPMKLKEDILSCSFSELSFGLCQFIQEVRRPNGEKYDPDSILYLCLGIQQVIVFPEGHFVGV